MRFTITRLAPLALAGLALLLPSSASATATKRQIKAAVAGDVGFLEAQQQSDGGFEFDWVINSLAAAGVPAAEVKSAGASTDARSWYVGLVGDPETWPGAGHTSVTEFDRATLNAYAAGIDPARVSIAQNLIAQIVSRYQSANPGYYGAPSVFSGTVFALLALAETKTRNHKLRVPQALLEKSVAVLRANQHDDGGWSFERVEGEPEQLAEPSEPDETGAAMAALCSAGVPSSNETITRAVAYLKADMVGATGAFEAPFGVNTDSNAWAVQGLDACGIEPQGTDFTSAEHKTPIDFLVSQQVGGSGFRFEPSEAEANEYSSQDALRSLAGAGFTAAPPRPKNGAPQWAFATDFEAGTQSQLTLVIEGGGSLTPCAVSIAPSTATTTLAAVLEAAKTSSTPAGCVSSFQPTSGSGAITQVNGSPVPPEAKWDVSIDGANQKAAKRNTRIELGDTIYLRLA